MQNVETESCAADRDEGGRRDVFSAQIVDPVYIRCGGDGRRRSSSVGAGRVGWREGI